MAVKRQSHARFSLLLALLVGLSAGLSAASAPCATTPAAGSAGTNAATPGSGGPAAFLSARAPYGMARAKSAIVPAADRSDTLWVTVDPGADYRTMIGCDLQITFHAAPGDTLTPYWWFGGGTANTHNVKVDFPQRSWPAPSPYKIAGFGGANFNRTPTEGRLGITFAVPADSAAWIHPGTRYGLARIILPAADNPAWRSHPVCIELSDVRIGIDLAKDALSVGNGGDRCVSWGDPSEKVCEPYRRARHLPAWKPPSHAGGSGKP